MRILIIEDEIKLQRQIQLQLEAQGFVVDTCSNGKEGLYFASEYPLDAAIIDIGLPDLSGLDVIAALRKQGSLLPILILTARNSWQEKVKGLEIGADDYLTKPFNLEELLLRVEKLIEKNKKIQDKDTVGETYLFGNNKVDFKAQEAVNFKGETIQLSKKESMLLHLLVENKNEVVTREKILQVVWGYNVYPTTRTIDNFILNFRKYFEEDSRNPLFFHSVRGVGYKYSE